MNNIRKLLICLILALSVLMASCAGDIAPGLTNSGVESAVSADDTSFTGAESGEPQTSVEDSSEDGNDTEFLRSGVYFDDIAYERPDFNEISEKIDAVSALYENNANAEDIKTEFDDLNDLMWNANTQYSLLSIMQSLDTTNGDISDEMVTLSESYTNTEQFYYQLADTLLDSYCGETVFADSTEEEKQEIRNYASLIDDDYVALSTKLTEYENEYIDNMSITVSADGKEMTLQEVFDNYGYTSYVKALNAAGGEIYLEIVDIYKAIAEKAGYASYADYAYANDYYRDYTTADSDKLHEYVKEYIAPMYAEYSDKVSYYSSKVSNNPFDYEDILLEYFSSVSGDMSDAYAYMKKYGMYSIDDDSVKQEGAYTTYLNTYDVPFIFEHTSGGYSDIQTFIHEFGHFYAYYLHGPDLPYMIDIDEIHSQSDELLFMPYYKEIYGEDAYKTISKYELNSNLGTIISGCMFDEFEQAVFAGDYDSVDELNALYSSICVEYGLTYAADYGWVLVQHLFLYPLYYISYAVSLIPSLEIYSASLEDREKGIDMYNDLLDKTVDCTGFIDLMNKSGFDNPFKEETIADIAETVKTIFG